MIKQAVFLDMASVDTGDLELRRLTQAVPELISRQQPTANAIAGAIQHAACVISNKVNRASVYWLSWRMILWSLIGGRHSSRFE